MRCLCTANTGADLPEPVLRLTRNYPTSRFDVTSGREYEIHSICVWSSGTLHYLVVDDSTGHPSWYPADLFVLTDRSIPSGWHFDYRGYDSEGNSSPILAILGYPEMVERREHYGLLQDRDRAALRVFREQQGGTKKH